MGYALRQAETAGQALEEAMVGYLGLGDRRAARRMRRALAHVVGEDRARYVWRWATAVGFVAYREVSA